jgi:PatG Domain
MENAERTVPDLEVLGSMSRDAGSACCATCASAAHVQPEPEPVWAIGNLRHEWANESAAMEYGQVRGAVLAQHATKARSNLTDHEILGLTLSDPEYRYLTRASCSCWILVVGGMPTYVLVPSDPAELDTLIKTGRTASGTDLGAVIGYKTGIAPAEMCHGLTLPMVIVHKAYNFAVISLFDSLLSNVLQRDAKDARPIPEEQKDRFVLNSTQVFDQLLRNAHDGTGNHRVLAWALVRSSGIYVKAYEMMRRDFVLTSASVHVSPLSSRLVRLTLRFTQMMTGFAESYCQDVNAEGLHPYLVNGLSLCLDR